MKKYYFVYYQCNRTNYPKNLAVNSSITYNQIVIDYHPLRFQLECNKQYNIIRDDGGGNKHKEHYQVITWNQLTKKEFDEYKGFIG